MRNLKRSPPCAHSITIARCAWSQEHLQAHLNVKQILAAGVLGLMDPLQVGFTCTQVVQQCHHSHKI